MDLLILILGVPAVLIPLVLLFGFAGCQPASRCTEDLDCPTGTQCVDGQCVVLGQANDPPPPPLPSAPENLAAIARDDQSVSLTWINTDPAATDFRIERMPEDGDEFVAIPPRRIFPTPARRMRRRACRRASHSYTAFGRWWESKPPDPRTRPRPRSCP
jgi:hypothetical protein